MIKTLGLTFAAAALAVQSASANSITLGDISSSGSGPSTWTYGYAYANSWVMDGDYFTINDFGPATVVLAPGGSWVFSQALTGPNSLLATDDAGILNATFTWSGTGVNFGPGTIGSLSFSLQSPFDSTPVLTSYTSLDHIASGNFAGNPSSVIGSLSAPTAPRPNTVPDGGSTVILLGTAIMGLFGIARKSLRIA